MASNRLNTHSLLWKIDHPDNTKTSYVYGTIHLLCESDFEIKKKVASAFDSCEMLVMELNLGDSQELQKLNELNYSEQTLSSQLSDEEQHELDYILRSQYNSSLPEMDGLAPVMIINAMINKAITCDAQKIYEMEFLALAQKRQMHVAALESAEEQIAIAKKIYTASEIVRQLREGDSYPDIFENMVEAYKNEDLLQLMNLVADRRFMSQEAEDTMVIDRNHLWCRRMPAMMQQRSVFFAVGAGHLPGENGLLKLLSDRGFVLSAVEPVIH